MTLCFCTDLRSSYNVTNSAILNNFGHCNACHFSSLDIRFHFWYISLFLMPSRKKWHLCKWTDEAIQHYTYAQIYVYIGIAVMDGDIVGLFCAVTDLWRKLVTKCSRLRILSEFLLWYSPISWILYTKCSKINKHLISLSEQFMNPTKQIRRNRQNR
jgi:hypothetical protein